MILDFQNNKWRFKVSRSVVTIPNERILNLGLQFTSQYLIIQVSTNNQLDTGKLQEKSGQLLISLLLQQNSLSRI